MPINASCPHATGNRPQAPWCSASNICLSNTKYMPQVTYETVWDTTKFNSMWASGAPNPFVWSFEGSTGVNGAGTHADYMFGWKGDALQRAMNKSECFYDGCGSTKKQTMSTASQCTVKDMVGEETLGCTSLARPVTQLVTDFSYRARQTPRHVIWKLDWRNFVYHGDQLWLSLTRITNFTLVLWPCVALVLLAYTICL
jgi:hypothetical protein